MDCHFLLQGIFLTQELNPGLPHCRQTLYRLSHQGRHLTECNYFSFCACEMNLCHMYFLRYQCEFSRQSMGSLRHVILGRKCWQRRENRDSWKPELRMCEDRLSQASEGVRGFLTDLPSDGGSYLLCCQYLPSWLVLLSGHTLVWQAQLIINLKGFFILFFIFSLEIHLCLSPLEIWFSGCGWSQAKSKQDAVEEGSCLEMTASEDSENIIKHNSTF